MRWQACHKCSERSKGYYWQKKKQDELIEKLQDNQSKIVQAIALIYSNVHS